MPLAVPSDDAAEHGNGVHDLTVVHNTAGLQQLLERCTPSAQPAVLQPFIPHGDCMFKVWPGMHITSGHQVICMLCVAAL